MAIAGGGGLFCHGSSYRYQPIDRDGPCSSCGQRRRRPVLVASALVCAIVGAAFGFQALKGSQLSSQPEEPSTLAAKGHAWRLEERHQKWQQQQRQQASLGNADAGFQVRVSNQYQRGENATTDLSLYPWEHVAEPYRETTLELTSVPEGFQDGADVIWKVEEETIGEGAGRTLVKTSAFTTPGQYKCSVIVKSPEKSGLDPVVSPPRAPGATNAAAAAENMRGLPPSRPATASAEERTAKTSDGRDRGAVFVFEFLVTVKYVRREIRALTDRDRETFFNAVSVLQRVPSAVGRAVYGDKYYSKDYFNRMHLYYGAGRDCDHWHAGAGFVTAHIAITLMYEQALQAVNPSIALPYWDVTIEGTFYDWSNFRTSPVFSDDWFGEGAPDNSFKTPSKGRFAYVPVMTDAREYSATTNSYGLLRSPWNSDPNPFLTRSDHLMGFVNNKKPSGCRRFRDAYIAQNWMELTEAFNGGAHGNIHGLLGGTWSPEADEFAAVTPYIVIPFIHHAYISQKIMWRTSAIECPLSCTFDQPWKDCQCLCNTGLMEGRTAAEFLELADVISSGYFYDADYNIVRKLADSDGHYYDEIPGYTKNETEAIYEGLRDVLCIPTKVGSHFEATSTNDHTFWVLHGAFDRLWHLSRLEQKPSFNETWISDNTCTGHNEFDIQPFHDLFLEDRSDKGEAKVFNAAEAGSIKDYYTNGELYDLLHPGEMNLPYVYDNFEWPHCDAQGVYIN